MKTEEENMLYIKKYSGFIISIVIGLLLYEEANYAHIHIELQLLILII